MEIGVVFKHRINYKQRYKSRVKINGVVLCETVECLERQFSSRRITKIYVTRIIFNSFSLSRGTLRERVLNVCAVYMCVCIKETQHSHLEGGGRENSRNQLIRDANRKAVNKRKKRMEKKNWPAKAIRFKHVRLTVITFLLVRASRVG